MFHLLPYNMDGAQPELVDTLGDSVVEATFMYPSCYAQISFGNWTKELMFISSTGRYRSYIDVVHSYFGVHELVKCVTRKDSIGRQDRTEKGTPVYTEVQGVCYMDHLSLGLLPGTSFKYRLWHVQYPQSEGFLRRVKEVVVDDTILWWMNHQDAEDEHNFYLNIHSRQRHAENKYVAANKLF